MVGVHPGWERWRLQLPAILGGADYLLWWFKGAPLPVPLVTTGNLNDSVPGALGQPNTQVLFGGRDYNTSPIHSGYKLTEGCWLNQEMTLGMEASGF